MRSLLLVAAIVAVGCQALPTPDAPHCAYRPAPRLNQLLDAELYMRDQPVSSVFDPTKTYEYRQGPPPERLPPPEVSERHGKELHVAEEAMRRRENGDVAVPQLVVDAALDDETFAKGMAKFGTFAYIKAGEEEIWVVDSNRVLGSGVQGCVRRAWKLDALIEDGKARAAGKRAGDVPSSEGRGGEGEKSISGGTAAEMFVVKEINVKAAEGCSGQPYFVELDVLADLGRLRGGRDVIVAASGVRHAYRPEVPCAPPALARARRNWEDRCAPGAVAYLLQTYVRGLNLMDNPDLFRPEAWRQIRPKIVAEVEALHALRWQHNDMHGRNIMVEVGTAGNGEREYTVRLVDFSLSSKPASPHFRRDAWHLHRLDDMADEVRQLGKVVSFV